MLLLAVIMSILHSIPLFLSTILDCCIHYLQNNFMSWSLLGVQVNLCNMLLFAVIFINYQPSAVHDLFLPPFAGLKWMKPARM
jgi:hypothetical protein